MWLHEKIGALPQENPSFITTHAEITRDARPESEGLTDYKFYCFDGKPKYLYVSQGLDNHATALISFLTMDWKFAAFGRSDYTSFESLPEKPECFKEMVKIASELSSGFPFLRVDMYEINGKVFFSELTFSPCGGMMPFDPPEWDEKIGLELTLPFNGQNREHHMK